MNAVHHDAADRKRAARRKWRQNNRVKDLEYRKRWARDNREKIAEYRRRYTAKYPEKHRARVLMQNTGLTLAQYEELLVKQGGLCAICKHVSQDGRVLCVDHDHATGRVRGLLCTYCNTGLGLFKDSIATLTSAIKYLS